MSDFSIDRVITFDTHAGPRLDRVGGQGWVDTAARVAGFIESGAHRFGVTVGGRQLWVAVQAGPDGSRELVVDDNGRLVPLIDLPLARSGMAGPPPPPPSSFTMRLRRFLDAGSRM